MTELVESLLKLMTGGFIISVLGLMWNEHRKLKIAERQNAENKLMQQVKDVHAEAHQLTDDELGSRIRALLDTHSGN